MFPWWEPIVQRARGTIDGPSAVNSTTRRVGLGEQHKLADRQLPGGRIVRSETDPAHQSNVEWCANPGTGGLKVGVGMDTLKWNADRLPNAAAKLRPGRVHDLIAIDERHR